MVHHGAHELNARVYLHLAEDGAEVRCHRAALPQLLRAAEIGPRNVADIVNISSVAGRVARGGSGAYNASKWAVNAFSESLRQK